MHLSYRIYTVQLRVLKMNFVHGKLLSMLGITLVNKAFEHFFARPFFKNASQRKAVEAAPRQQMLK